MLVDTHCHLGDQQFDGDRAAVVDRAGNAGVGHAIVVADSAESAATVLSVAREFGLSATAGVHPHAADSWSADVEETVSALLAQPEVVAVGEVGLDYHYDFSPRDVQLRVFERQLEMAAGLRLPVVVHSREADEDMAAVIRSATGNTLVMHSFSSGPSVLDAALEGGHYVSFSGMVTFKSWDNAAAVRTVPADRIMVETDSPYLAPVPHRGKRNEPAFVVEVASRVAEIRGVSDDEIAAITTTNAVSCFGDRLNQAQKPS